LIDEINVYNKTSQEIFQTTWKEPNSKDIAQRLWFPLKKIKKLEEVIFGNISLDTEVGDDWKNSIWDFLEDSNTKKPNEFVDEQMINSNLNKIFNMLDERESKIIKMRYWIDWPKYTLEQVWAEFDVTRERVRQIEQKVLQKLKDHEWLQKLLWIEDSAERYNVLKKLSEGEAVA